MLRFRVFNPPSLQRAEMKHISSLVEPITFKPIYMTRVWGGRELQNRLGRILPVSDLPFGESWEIVDRMDHQSVVNHGPLCGATLHDLWSQQRDAIFGDCPQSERFPLLIKILDTHQDLSIQVHPPESVASELHGEAKNEMWYIIDSQPGAKLHVGLREGTDREKFARAIEKGSIADCIHTIQAMPGNSIYIPSGRIHAIGGGFLIHEIQQNSDTTYRVHDWNRLGLDGKPRELHIDASLRCIDFEDIEPHITKGLCDHECPQFHTLEHSLDTGDRIGNPDPKRFSILTMLEGTLHSENNRAFTSGTNFILPKGTQLLTAGGPVKLLQTVIP